MGKMQEHAGNVRADAQNHADQQRDGHDSIDRDHGPYRKLEVQISAVGMCDSTQSATSISDSLHGNTMCPALMRGNVESDSASAF